MTNIFIAKQKIKESKALIFDFDGTLVNLDKLNVESYRKMFEAEFKTSFTRKDFMNFISGKGSRDGIKSFLAEYEIFEYDLERIQAVFTKAKKEMIKHKFDRTIYTIPGIEQFLKYAFGLDKAMVIATSSRRVYVEKILRKFELYNYFDHVFDRTDVQNSKPAPDVFNMAIDFTGFSKDECVAFEDSLFGLKASKNAGLYTIGIRNPGWNDDFVDDIADAVVESYEELI